jgi:hypothetical protein
MDVASRRDSVPPTNRQAKDTMNTLQNIPLKRIDRSDDTLAAHRGKVLLIVNVA